MPRLLGPMIAAVLLMTALPAHAAGWQWPLSDGRVVRPFDAAASEYGPGHRGVDLPGSAGQAVRAVADGRVSFAGSVAGIPAITVVHGAERSTYQPVDADVDVGESVVAGQPIGRLRDGHRSCRAVCLHLGRLRGDRRLDPATLLPGSSAYRLISPDGPPPAPPSPTPGDLPLTGPITSPFGMRVHPVTGALRLHDGVDIAAACGTAVPAVASGDVVRAGPNGPYGLQVEIRRPDGARTSYSHLSSAGVGVGEPVRAGQIIGRVGSTGLSTGCHLHFMRWVEGRPVDPLTSR